MTNQIDFDSIETQLKKDLNHFCEKMSEVIGQKLTPEQVLASPDKLQWFSRMLVLQKLQLQEEAPAKRQRAAKVAAPNTEVHDTRSSAFKSIQSSGKRMTQRERVLEAIQTTPGMTREEVANALGMRTQSCTARVCELLQLGAIFESGTKRGSSGMEQARLYSK